MHTVMVLGGALVLLGICVGVSRLLGGSAAKGALAFIPLWFLGAAINMWFGVRAGYSVKEELPMFALVFALPAAAALAVWRWVGR